MFTLPPPPTFVDSFDSSGNSQKGGCSLPWVRVPEARARSWAVDGIREQPCDLLHASLQKQPATRRREAVPGDGKPRVNGGNAHVQASGLLPGGDTQHGARVSNSPREPAARCVAPAPRAGPAAASRPLPLRCAADAAVPSNGAFWFNSLHTRSLRD